MIDPDVVLLPWHYHGDSETSVWVINQRLCEVDICYLPLVIPVTSCDEELEVADILSKCQRSGVSQVQGAVSLTATDCPTGRRTILQCYLSIGRMVRLRSDGVGPSLLVKHPPG